MRSAQPHGAVRKLDFLAVELPEQAIQICTAYHLLGVDPRTELVTPLGRPVPLVGGGSAVRELL